PRAPRYFEAFVVAELDIRQNFDVDGKRNWLLAELAQPFTVLEVKLRLAERREFVLLNRFLHRVGQQFAQKLRANLIFEARAHHAARSMTRTKTGHVRSFRILVADAIVNGADGFRLDYH